MGRIARRIVHAVDPAAVTAMPAADAEADLVLHDRAAHSDPDFVARIAMQRLRKFRPGKDLENGEVRLRGDVADGAAFRSGDDKSALRTASWKERCGGEGCVGMSGARGWG